MMNFSLFEHQEKFVRLIKEDLVRYKRIIPVAPTGAGKTKIFTYISYSIQEKGNTNLIITESDKIFKQILKERPVRTIKAGVKFMPIEAGKVYLAMAQTLIRRPKMIEDFAALGKRLIVTIDEAHIGTPTKILEQLKEAYFMGFTATPDARAGKHIYQLYNKVTVTEEMQPEWLVNHNRLASYRHLARQAADLSELKVEKGEYTEESQEKAFSSKVVYDGLENDLHQLEYKKAIIYCSSIKHAEHTYDLLIKHGFNCAIVHSQSKAGELEKFMFSDTKICVSVGILTKGFDFPPIDLVVLYRKTKSLPLYLQMCGRGSRLTKGKTSFTVLDYGENFMEHEYWITERDWVELAKEPKKNKKKKKLDVPPVKSCPSCEALVPVSTRICPYCGYEFSQKEMEPPPDSVLIDITERYQSLKGKRISELSPGELATYIKITGKRQYGIRIARRLTDKDPGYLRQYAIEMGYSKVFHHIKEKEESQEFNDIIIK